MPTGSTRTSRLELVAAGDRDFRRQPAAERQPDQREPVVRQLVDQREIEVHEIVDRVEIGRALGVAETRRGRRDDLGVASRAGRETAPRGGTVSMPCSSRTGVPAPRRSTSSSMPFTVIRSSVRIRSSAMPRLPIEHPASCHGRAIRAAAHCRASPADTRGSRRNPRRRAGFRDSAKPACGKPAPAIHYGPRCNKLKGGDPVSFDQPRSTVAVTRILLAEVLA